MHNTRPYAALAAVVIVGLAGCGRTLMPTPALYYEAEADPFVNVPEQRRSNIVEILYATDRKPQDRDWPGVFYGAMRSPSLAFGAARVRIGRPDLGWDELTAACRGRKRSRSLSLQYLDAEELVRLPHWPWYVNLADDPAITEEDVDALEAEAVEEIHVIFTGSSGYESITS